MIPGVQEIKALALKYSKKQLANMAQTGLIDPQKAVMAGMMRDRIAKEDMQPPSTTVAQDVLGLSPQPQMGMQPPPQMAQAQPQVPPPQMGAPIEQPPVMAASGGLTNIPVEIHDYAGGGIVAFDEGGKVPGYKDEGLVYSPFKRAIDSFLDPIANRMDEAREREQLQNNIRAKFDQYSGVGGFFSPQTEEHRAFVQQTIPNLNSMSTDELRRLSQIQPQPTSRDMGVPNAATTSEAPAAPAPEAPAPAAQNKPSKPSKPNTGKNNAGTSRDPATSTGPTTPGFKRPNPADYLPDLTQLKPEAFSTRAAQELPAIGKERMDYMRSMGVDPDMYNKMIAKQEIKRGELKGRKEEAKGLALMEASLGLIGARRGEEFQRLGEAGRKGLASLTEAGKELRLAEEKLDDRINSFRMADQQFKQTGAEKDLTKRENELNRVEAAKREEVKERNTFTAKRAELGMEGAKVRTQAEVALHGQDVQADLERQKIKIQAQQAANQAAYYSKSLALTEQRIKSMDAATQARYSKLKLEAGKMWDGSDDSRRLTAALKSEFGDNFMKVPKAQERMQQARDMYIGYYLDQNGSLIHTAPYANDLMRGEQ
jgi:hypothetical protein